MNQEELEQAYHDASKQAQEALSALEEGLEKLYEDASKQAQDAIDQAQKAMSPPTPRYAFIMIDLNTNGEFVRFLGGRVRGVLPPAPGGTSPPKPHAPENGKPAGSWNFEATPGCAWKYHYGKWYWVCT